MTEEDKIIFSTSSAHILTHSYLTILPVVLLLMSSDRFIGMGQYVKLGGTATLFYALFGVGTIPARLLVDKVGAMRMLRISVFTMAVASLTAGFCFSGVGLITAMIFLGLGASMYHPAGLSVLSKNVAAQRKDRATELHSTSGGLGLVFGPLLSGSIASLWGWRAAFLLFAILGFSLGAMLLELEVDEKQAENTETASPEQSLTQASSLILFLVFGSAILYGLCYRGAMMFLPTHFATNITFALNSAGKAGLLISAVNLAGLFGKWLGEKMCENTHKPERAYILIFICTTPLFFAMSIMRDWSLFIICLIFAPFFYAWKPVGNALAAKYSLQPFHGIKYGLNFTLLIGIGSLAATIGGFITDTLGVSWVFAFLGILSGLCLWLIYYVMKQMEPKYVQA